MGGFVKDNRGTIASVAAIGVCAATAGVGCAINIEQSAQQNVIGKENPNWWEFGTDVALSYTGGKAIGYARDLSRPLAPLARTDDILEASVRRRPFQRLENFNVPKATKHPVIERVTQKVAAQGPGSALSSPTTNAQYAYRGAVGVLGARTQRELDDRIGQSGSK